MSIYLKKFETTSAYETYIASEDKVLPNVSFCEDARGMRYNPKSPHDYSKDYFTMVVTNGGGDIKWYGTTTNNALSYSIDGGETWSTASNKITLRVNEGDKVLWKGTTTPEEYMGIGMFNGDADVRYSVEGNAMSLLFGDSFKGETSLESKDYALYGLFQYNTNVTSAENLSLPATTLADCCYQYMFQGCTSLTTAPQLLATTLVQYCYDSMFQGCTSLTTAPELPATTLTDYCYNNMFDGCTSLTTAPRLSATTLAPYCYSGMFQGCTSLTTAPELPAITLADWCYQSMFQGCTSLTTAPELPATSLAEGCYASMFDGTNILPDCSNIDFTSETVVSSGGLRGLFSGTKITDAQLDVILKEHGINDYSLPVTTLTNSCYSSMFADCTNLTTAPELPATTLASNCYSFMFGGCTSLTTAPQLPATTLGQKCYIAMFQGCTSLTTAPQLPATTLANSCYQQMFSGCTSLTTAPSVLPATTLTNSCYQEMFNKCTSLTTAPELPATTLTNSCYNQMFSSCTKLKSIKCLATDISASSCTFYWVSSIPVGGTFTKNASMSNWTKDVNGIPLGWTVKNA